MKSLVVITTSYFPFNGGGEVGVKRFIQGIKASYKDYRISVLTPRYHSSHPEFETRDGVEVFRYNSCFIRYPSRLLPNSVNILVHMIYGFISIGRYIKRINPDFAMINFLLPSAFPAIYHLRRLHISNLLFLAGNDIHNKNFIIKRTNDYVFKRTGGIIMASEFVRKSIKDQYETKGLNLNVIPYGIDIDEYSCVTKKVAAQVKILCVQRLVRIKGTEYLVLALGRLISEGISNFVVDIVGDGEDRSRLEDLAASLNLQGRVTFHGNVENDKIKRFYQNSDFFIFPTLTEPFGIVLLEAMATSNIIIASRCGAIPEILRDQHTGILVEPGVPGGIRQAMERLADDAELGMKLEKRGYERLRRFSWIEAAKQTHALYERVAGGGRDPSINHSSVLQQRGVDRAVS